MTFGLGPCGYDVRIEFDKDGAIDHLTMPPGDFILTSTMEQIWMPRDLVATVHDKSSWARRGLSVQNTVIEPNWCGFLTLELHNQSHQHIYLERGMPIAQIMFHMLDEPTDLPYCGKYQMQKRGPIQSIHQEE